MDINEQLQPIVAHLIDNAKSSIETELRNQITNEVVNKLATTEIDTTIYQAVNQIVKRRIDGFDFVNQIIQFGFGFRLGGFLLFFFALFLDHDGDLAEELLDAGRVAAAARMVAAAPEVAAPNLEAGVSVVTVNAGGAIEILE